jgi:hypothetical protein
MKKYFLLALSLFILESANADIIKKLSAITRDNAIEFPVGRYGYMFSIYTENNNLAVDVFSDGRAFASIVAYKMDNSSIKMIIKKRMETYAILEASGNRIYIDADFYYLVEIEEVSGKLEYYYYIIEEMNLNGFTSNDAEIYEDTGAKPAPDSQYTDAFKLKKGIPIKIVSVEKQGESEGSMYDYWFKTEIDKKTYWVFGFFIEFKNRMKLER